MNRERDPGAGLFRGTAARVAGLWHGLLEVKPAAWLGILVVLLTYTVLYLGYPNTPGNNPRSPLGWWGWFDQKTLRIAAEAIAQGAYNAESHRYPIGYPLLGAPFAEWMPNHLFFL
ncbi:MAG: hypothetical protein JRJ84_24290, partial [Deltaproteobacteria bacterium]|nr:hypothetical protein [Deltaproteobacteria bacterium]